MTRSDLESDWCRRLGDAIVDGRFGEEPEGWRSHWEGCPRCRRAVEGYFLLRRLIEKSRPPPSGPAARGPAPDSPRALALAFRRYRRFRLVRAVGTVALALLLLGAGYWVFMRREQAPARPAALDPEAAVLYAQGLFDRLHPPGEPSQLGRLASEPDLEHEYLAALGHPSQVVRRMACLLLVTAGRPIPPETTRRLLEEARPQLEAPLELAAAGDSGRRVAESLASGRAALLRTVLGGLRALAARGGERAPPGDLVPYLDDADGGVREAALLALADDPSFRPGPEVHRLLVHDPQPAVRRWSAALIAQRGGEEDRINLVRHFAARPDAEVEEWSAALLGSSPEAVALARRRAEDSAAPLHLALRHALQLCASGAVFERRSLAERALLADDESAWLLGECAAAGGWDDLRDRLQERWRHARDVHRLNLGAALVRWDLKQRATRGLDLAFEVLADGPNRALRPTLDALRDDGDPRVRERAEEAARAWGTTR